MLAAALARDPDADVGRGHRGLGAAVVLGRPRDRRRRSSRRWRSRVTAIEQGMYIEPFAEQRVFAIGLEPPPMMWIFEWDILTGDSAVLDVIYAISRDATGGDIEAAIAGGEQAVADAEEMRDLVASTDAATWRDAGAARRVPRHPRLRGRRAAAARGVPRDDPAPGAVARHARRPTRTTPGTTRPRRVRGARRRARRAVRRATSTTPRTTSPPPSSASSAPTATWRWRGSRACCSLLAGALGRDRHARRAHPARAPARRRGRARVVARRDPAVARARVDARACCRSTAGCCSACPRRLLVATRAVQTSFLSWTHLAVVLGAWLVFVARRAAARRPPLAVAGHRRGRRGRRAAVHRDAARAVVHRPGRLLVRVLDRARRAAPSTSRSRSPCSCGCSSPPGWALAAQVGRRRATGIVLAGVGAGLAVPAPRRRARRARDGAHASGTTRWGCCPWGLARILGITVYLDIPARRRRGSPPAFGLVLAVRRRAARAALRARRSPAEPEAACRRPDELSRARSTGCSSGRARDAAAPRRIVSGCAPRLEGMTDASAAASARHPPP